MTVAKYITIATKAEKAMDFCKAASNYERACFIASSKMEYDQLYASAQSLRIRALSGAL